MRIFAATGFFILLVSAGSLRPYTQYCPMEHSTDQKNFTTSFRVTQSPDAVYEAAKNFRAWWSESIEGPTDELDQPFFYHYKTVHLCRLKPTEMIPGKKLVYTVLANEFNFTTDKSEWVGTRLVFDISRDGDSTVLTFTHEGLVPGYQCYEVCRDAWMSYIQGSLKSLIETGKGNPNPAEGGLNEELIEKWGLPKK